MPNTSSEDRLGRILRFSAPWLVAALLAYAAFLVSQSWREAKSGQARQLATIAALSANSVDIYFSQLQIGMRDLGDELPVTNSKADLDRAYTMISRFQGLHSELSNVMLIRSDGQILLVGTNPDRSDLPTLAHEPAFKQIRDELQQDSPFAIGRPVTGNIDKSWVVAARYGVTDDAGKLIYIISANLPVGMMQHYWMESITPGITALGLVRDDGYLVSRYPEPDTAAQDKLYGKPIEGPMADYLRTNRHATRGLVEISNDGSNTEGLQAMHRLQHYPLTLFVEMPATEIRAAWWHAMHAPYFLMALVLACAFAFCSLRFRRHAWSVEKRREELRHHYEHALRERSPNEIFMVDAETLLITYANDYARQDLGYTLEELQQKTLLALQPEIGIESFGAKLDQLRQSKHEPVIYQTVQTRADGRTYPVEVNLQLIVAEFGGERILAIVHDITALTQIEENIRKFNAPFERRGGK